ncbi:MAG TPA: DUF1727 domain-containing protein [Corynebacteriales bacterium]|nr:DUF1727 domain-containing protein [Mycobacteriales bacterium]
MTTPSLGLRARLARAVAKTARWTSRTLRLGDGGMIGGLLALKVDPQIMGKLSAGRPCVLVTGTNGKSTTTRMLATALGTKYRVAWNEGGDNMDAGIVSALLDDSEDEVICLEVDEMHVPHVMDTLHPTVMVLLNLSRDQLDRVGEINTIEKRLRTAVTNHPETTLIANCDDMMMTSVAYDHPRTIWVSTGGNWSNDATTSPRNNAAIVHSGNDWYAVEKLADGREFRRPSPTYWVDDAGFHGPDGLTLPLELRVPGKANRGNAAQAIVAAIAMGISPHTAVTASEKVEDVSGRYSTMQWNGRNIRLLLAKNPAGWQEALNMANRDADSLVIAVNGQQGDGIDLSWLWDVLFENFSEQEVIASGERATDLAVRLTYADIPHTLVHDSLEAIKTCPAGDIEVIANYTAFRELFLKLRSMGSSTAEKQEAQDG